MNIDFATCALVINASRTKTALIFHNKLQKRMQPWGHIEPWEFPHEWALREVKEELGIDWKMDIEIHKYAEAMSKNPWFVPNPVAICRSLIPAHKNIAEHEHCDMWYIILADDSQDLGWEENQSKRMTKQEVMDLADTETFQSVKQMVTHYLI